MYLPPPHTRVQEGYGFVPSDDDEDDYDQDDGDDYLYNGENEDDENDYGYDTHREASQPPTDTAASAAAAAAAGGTAPGQLSGGGGAASVQPGAVANVAGAEADAAARKQANKKKKKKKKKTSVVEQLKAKEASGASSNGVDGVREGGERNAGKEGGDGSEVSPPPEMGLLDAVAAMILGENSCCCVGLIVSGDMGTSKTNVMQVTSVVSKCPCSPISTLLCSFVSLLSVHFHLHWCLLVWFPLLVFFSISTTRRASSL